MALKFKPTTSSGAPPKETATAICSNSEEKLAELNLLRDGTECMKPCNLYQMGDLRDF